MIKTLTQKDYILISAYIDGELTATKKADVEKHLQSNDNFKIALRDLAYTKRIMAAMPRVRAPRNFMLTPDRVKKTAKTPRFQPVWGMVSAFSTLILLVIFASTRLLPIGATRNAAPAMAPAADSALSAEKMASSDITPTPMIILWNPPRAFGMGGGGGGGGAEGSGLTTGGMGGGPPMPTPTMESPAPLAIAPQSTLDPSKLILGIPDPAERGQTLPGITEERSNWLATISTTTWLMIGSGLLALASALLAIFTRRR